MPRISKERTFGPGREHPAPGGRTLGLLLFALGLGGCGEDEMSRILEPNQVAMTKDVAPIYGVLAVFALLYLYLTRDTFSLNTVNNLMAYMFPLILAAMAQSVVMLTGGIDLAIGQLMSLVTVVLATQMYAGTGSMLKALVIVLVGGGLLGMFTGSVVTLIRLPAIIVTLATSFIWAGWALYVLSVPGGHLPRSFARGFTGKIGQPLAA